MKTKQHTDNSIEDTTLAWSALEKQFSNVRGMSLSPMFINGIGERMGWKRMQRLEARRVARQFSKIVAPLSLHQLRYLKERSSINLKLASDAMRLFLVANVSIPIGSLLLVNQFSAGFITRVFETLPFWVVFIPTFMGLSMLIVSAWYAYAGLHQARDLHHLITIHIARLKLESGPVFSDNLEDQDSSDDFETDETGDSDYDDDEDLGDDPTMSVLT